MGAKSQLPQNESLKYQNKVFEDVFKILDYNSDEIENKFRFEHTSNYKSGFKANNGAKFEYAKFFANTFNKIFVCDQPHTINNDSFFDLFKWGIKMNQE